MLRVDRIVLLTVTGLVIAILIGAEIIHWCARFGTISPVPDPLGLLMFDILLSSAVASLIFLGVVLFRRLLRE